MNNIIFKKDLTYILPREILIYLKEHVKVLDEDVYDGMSGGDRLYVDMIPLTFKYAEYRASKDTETTVFYFAFLCILLKFLRSVDDRMANCGEYVPNAYTREAAMCAARTILEYYGVKTFGTCTACNVDMEDKEKAQNILKDFVDCSFEPIMGNTAYSLKFPN